MDLYLILENAQKKLINLVQSRENFLAEMSVSIAATLSSSGRNRLAKEIKINILKKSKNNLRNLALLSWFLNDDLGCLIRMQILKEVEDKIGFHDVRFLCQKKININFYLIKIAQTKGPNHLFGNLLQKAVLLKSLNSFKIRIYNPNVGPKIPPKRMIGVGYRDKGHLPEPSHWKPTLDYSLSKLQDQIQDQKDFNLISDILNEETYY